MNGASFNLSRTPFDLIASFAMCGAFGMFLILIGFWPGMPGRVGTGLPSAARRLAALFCAEVANDLLVHKASLL
jgi:hypothetical protein